MDSGSHHGSGKGTSGLFKGSPNASTGSLGLPGSQEDGGSSKRQDESQGGKNFLEDSKSDKRSQGNRKSGSELGPTGKKMECNHMD